MKRPIKYIFCINTGRSGSKYLTELLSGAANGLSLHEDFPVMNGQPMEAWNQGSPHLLEKLMEKKWQRIQSHRKQSGKIYCETNHSFIKGWGYLVPDTYIPQEEIGVIILRREPQKIAGSLLRMHSVPGRTFWSRNWYLSPGAEKNQVPFSPNGNPKQACLWYVDEIEKRAEEFQKLFPNIHYFPTSLAELNDHRKISELFDFLGLQKGNKLKKMVGKVVNQRSEIPRDLPDTPSWEDHYLNPDQLESEARNKLLEELISYVDQNYPTKFKQASPDRSVGGSYLSSVAGIVLGIEAELERKFQVKLMYSQLAEDLAMELLFRHFPYDPVWIFVHRFPEAQPRFQYDFNQIPTIPYVFKKFGFMGTLKLIMLNIKTLREPNKL